MLLLIFQILHFYSKWLNHTVVNLNVVGLTIIQNEIFYFLFLWHDFNSQFIVKLVISLKFQKLGLSFKVINFFHLKFTHFNKFIALIHQLVIIENFFLYLILQIKLQPLKLFNFFLLIPSLSFKWQLLALLAIVSFMYFHH